MVFIGIDMRKINKIISILTHIKNFITKIIKKAGINKAIRLLVGETTSLFSLL